MNTSSSDVHRALIERAAHVFDQILTDVEPYGQPQHLIALLLFRRLTEAQKECCDAILNLYDHNLFRPAYGILRTLYEHSAAQVWLHRSPIAHQWVLLDGNRPKMGRILREIGWPDDSVAPYAETSRVAHPTIRSAYFSHDLDLAAEPVASWVRTRDLSSLAHHLLWDCAKLADEDQGLSRVYLALNTFDVTVSSERLLYSPSAAEQEWWPGDALPSFEAEVSRSGDLQGHLLWNTIPWQSKSKSRLERDIEATLNAPDEVG